MNFFLSKLTFRGHSQGHQNNSVLLSIKKINSFEKWSQNLLYLLSLDNSFAEFFIDGTSWETNQNSSPIRGLTDDNSEVPSAELGTYVGQVARQKILRNTIVKLSTSIDSIWQTIWLHFGFQCTGAHVLDFVKLNLNVMNDHMTCTKGLWPLFSPVRKNGGLSHHAEDVERDGDMSPYTGTHGSK